MPSQLMWAPPDKSVKNNGGNSEQRHVHFRRKSGGASITLG